MEELDETWVKAVWLKLAAQPPEETLTALQRFKEEHGVLFEEWSRMLESFSETATEIFLGLAVTVYQVLHWRGGSGGKERGKNSGKSVGGAAAKLDAQQVRRLVEAREKTLASFLKGKRGRSLPPDEALEEGAARFDLPQFALLGHAAEGLLAAHEDGELERGEVETAFVALVVLLDGIDRS